MLLGLFSHFNMVGCGIGIFIPGYGIGVHPGRVLFGFVRDIEVIGRSDQEEGPRLYLIQGVSHALSVGDCWTGLPTHL